MTVEQVMAELKAKGSEATKTLLLKHGAKEPFFGVKVGDLKGIEKKIRGDHALAVKLYATGNGDAQYLAGMVADGARLTSAQLDQWAKTAGWGMITGTILPWVTSEHPEGLAHALKWIDSADESVAVAGWRSLGALVTVVADDRLPVPRLSALLDRAAKTITAAPDDVRLAMNYYVIACGTYSAALGDKAIATARKIGKVEADMGDTACKIPDAESYIMKSRRGAPVAPKRKTVRC